MLSWSQRLKDGSGGIDARKGNVVTAPVELNVLLLKDKKDNQGGNGDGAREG